MGLLSDRSIGTVTGHEISSSAPSDTAAIALSTPSTHRELRQGMESEPWSVRTGLRFRGLGRIELADAAGILHGAK